VLSPGTNVESRFIRAGDGVTLHYLRWASTQPEPLAILVFLHGVASHAAWFAETAVDLVEQRVTVYAPDRRGSGLSGGRRGHLSSYAQALDDVEQVVNLASSQHQRTPLFLAASSWAAKLGLVYAALRPTQLSGLLLLGPGLLPRVQLSAAQRLAVIAGHLVTPTARVTIPLTPELYTTTPRYREFIRSDRLRLLTATCQFFWETGRLDRQRPDATARLRRPLLVLQGENDAMMDVPGTREWFATATVPDKTYRSYPGAGHTLDFEADRRRYLADLVDWLSTRALSPHPHAAHES
jgi:acylglycerol lipase